VVIILSGRYAGKKAVVLKTFDDGYVLLLLHLRLPAKRGARCPPIARMNETVALSVARRTALLSSVLGAGTTHICTPPLPCSRHSCTPSLSHLIRSTQRPFGHALVAGVERAPLKVSKSMSKKLVAKRSRVKPFIKVVNYNHIMPTRYSIDVDINKKDVVTMANLKDRDRR
jgi:ribosomal protein L14E/L6E/L27E